MDYRQGFTLIELMIVLVIVGVLTAIAVPQFSSARQRAYYAAVQSDLKNLSVQQEFYHADNYEYSASLADLNFVASEGVTVTPTATETGWSATATHEALADDEGCVMYSGDVTDKPSMGDLTASDPGVVECTG